MLHNDVADLMTIPNRLLEIPARAKRRLARFPGAISKLSATELAAVLHAYGNENAVERAARELRAGWNNDHVAKADFHEAVIEAQQRINALLNDHGFCEKLASTGWSDDAFAVVMHAVADALVYRKAPDTEPQINVVYGPLEQFYPWDTLGRAAETS